MESEKFLELYNRFPGTNRAFSTSEWDEAVKSWDKYYKLISSDTGVPFERWIKNEVEGYLPDFLDTKEQRFGHARIGNYEQVMIYKYTGDDKTRKNKYRNVYLSTDSKKCYNSPSDVENEYVKIINPLLSEIVKASSLEEIYAVEKSSEYQKFRCKQILRKITILNSVRDDSPYKNEFMWIFNEAALVNLSKILEVDIDLDNNTFLENNKLLYDIAKEDAGITDESPKTDYIKLYDFLWYLSDTISEFSNFNSINVIYNGAPGTGKTYGVTQGIRKLQFLNNQTYKESRYIHFHPAYTYQDFIEGIKPLGIVNGNLDLQVVNGSFKEFCIFVKKENEKYYKKLKNKPDVNKPLDFKDWPHYFFVVDEINRGNLSTIFGETFTLLEKGYRDYDFSGNYNIDTEDLVKENHLIVTALSNVISRLEDNNDLIYKKINNEIYFGIPFNIHFIGMMNDVDRSIDSFDLALRRRFKWIPKYCDYDVIKDTLINNGYSSEIATNYVADCKALNDFICDVSVDGLHLGKSYEIGHSFFMEIQNYPGRKMVTKDKKKELFDNYIAGTLKEYIRQVADDSEIDTWVSNAKKAFGIQ